MSGPGKNRVGTNVRGNECPGFLIGESSNFVFLFKVLKNTFV